MKRTMNKREIVRFSKFLDEGLSVTKISKLMHIEINTLKKFTPDKVAKSADAKKKIAAKAAEKAAEAVTGGNSTVFDPLKPAPAAAVGRVATEKPSGTPSK